MVSLNMNRFAITKLHFQNMERLNSFLTTTTNSGLIIKIKNFTSIFVTFFQVLLLDTNVKVSEVVSEINGSKIANTEN